MRSIHFSITTRRDGDLGGVPKFAWYLQRAIGCEVEPMHNANKFNLNEFDYIIADGSYINHFLQYKCKKISIIHGSWKEFCIRNNTNAFLAEAAIQGKAWTNPGIVTVAVSNSAAKYAIKHHNARIDHIINNAIDTDVFKPIAHLNVKPVVIHCAKDYNKTSYNRLDAIMEILLDKFEIRYLNAKDGEEHTKMAQGDVFLSCSNYEGNSYAVLEAMSCGLPIVGSNVGLFDNIVGNDKNGLIIDYKSTAREFAYATQMVYKRLSFYNPRQYVLDNANFNTWKEQWSKLLGE